MTNDYTIQIEDAFTGELLSLGDDEYCSVRFDGVGSPDLREAVYDVSGGDGVHFGIERYGAVNWTITGTVLGGTSRYKPGDPALAWQKWSQLSRAWINYPERTIPRAARPMYFQRPGRERMVVYGRPQRIDPDTATSHAGFISYSASFRQSDPRFFAANESVNSVSLGANYRGGIQLNDTEDGLLIPLSTTTADVRSSIISMEGDIATDVKLEFKGPVQNPKAVLKDEDGNVVWSIEIRTTVPNGVTVTVDSRQWVRSITTSNGASAAGAYFGPKLQDVVIPPGRSEVIYSGIDGTNTSLLEVKYRNAWASS